MNYLGINNTYYTEYFAPDVLTKSKHESEETHKIRGLINNYMLHRRFTLRDLVALMLRSGHLKGSISETHVIKSLSNSLASMKGLVRKRIKKRHQDPIPALMNWPLIQPPAPPKASPNLTAAVAATTVVVLAVLLTWVISL